MESYPPRIAFYTHDTFGLGHVRRCLNVIEATAGLLPEAAILLITGSPALSITGGLPRNADLVKLPTIAPTGENANHPPHLPIATESIIQIRQETISALINSFPPDVFFVDNFPLGARRELLSILRALRGAKAQTVLGLRDIVDAPDVVRRRWARDGMLDVLRDLYHSILVFGESPMFDARREYGLDVATAAKVRHCGYVARRSTVGASNPEFEALSRPRILITVGGGGDGLPLLEAAIGALTRLPGVSAFILSGPLQGAADREAVLGRAAALGHRVVVKPFIDDPTHLMSAADLVVSMAGYNTVAELLTATARMLLVPRSWRYGEHARRTSAGVEMEQVLRARMLSDAGLASMLDPAALSPETLAEAIRRAIARPRPPRPSWMHFDGAEVAAKILDELVRVRGKSDAA